MVYSWCITGRTMNLQNKRQGEKIMPTYCVKVVITADEIYEKLSDEDKKRFNRIIIADVSRDLEMNVELTCVAVNDCTV